MKWNQNSDDFAELIHHKSAEILAEVGFCAPEKTVLARLKIAGFLVDEDTHMVRIPGEILKAALETLPRDVKLYARGSQQAVDDGQGSLFMGAGTPVSVQDLYTGLRRDATRKDVRSLITIQDALPHVDIVRPTVTATDMGAYSDLVEIAELLMNTDKPVVHRTLSADRVEAAVEMLAAVAGGYQALRAYPNFATLYCPISPGYFTAENIRCMLKWAEFGIPVTLLSMAMGGASAPATILGELLVINTDILAWIVALQLLYPGTPLMYGSVSAVLDMRTGILPLGGPERGMVNSGAAIMGRYYGIPSMCGGLSSDAKELDAQAGLEKAVTAVPLLREKASIIYGVGAMDAGSAISYSQMVMDNEFIGALRRMMQGITVHDLDEEVELIKQLTPKGNFLKEKHTRKHYREHWQPQLFNRDSYDTWTVDRMTVEQKARLQAEHILEQHTPNPLPEKAEADIERILRRYQVVAETSHYRSV